MTPQQYGMLLDIRTATTLAELRSLATLESEYPLVFTNDIRTAFKERQALLTADKVIRFKRPRPYKQGAAQAKGQLHLPTFVSKFCCWCRRLRYALTGR